MNSCWPAFSRYNLSDICVTDFEQSLSFTAKNNRNFFYLSIYKHTRHLILLIQPRMDPWNRSLPTFEVIRTGAATEKAFTLRG